MELNMIIIIQNNGQISLPIAIRKLFSNYVSFIISNGNIIMRMPKFNDNWMYC